MARRISGGTSSGGAGQPPASPLQTDCARVLYNPQKSARLGNAVSGSAIVVCLLETLCFDSWINCLGFVN
jgi:hypothetical protein